MNHGPMQAIQNPNQWNILSKRGLDSIYLYINSLHPKIDELRSIAMQSNAAAIGVTKSKLNSSVCDTEISIDSYDIIHNNRNRRDGGVVCFVRKFNLL